MCVCVYVHTYATVHGMCACATACVCGTVDGRVCVYILKPGLCVISPHPAKATRHSPALPDNTRENNKTARRERHRTSQT